MSEKYKFHKKDGIYIITPTIVKWVDLSIRKEYCVLVLESFMYCHKGKRVEYSCIV